MPLCSNPYSKSHIRPSSTALAASTPHSVRAAAAPVAKCQPLAPPEQRQQRLEQRAADRLQAPGPRSGHQTPQERRPAGPARAREPDRLIDRFGRVSPSPCALHRVPTRLHDDVQGRTPDDASASATSHVDPPPHTPTPSRIQHEGREQAGLCAPHVNNTTAELLAPQAMMISTLAE
jgi:hypothetical protein